MSVYPYNEVLTESKASQSIMKLPRSPEIRLDQVSAPRNQRAERRMPFIMPWACLAFVFVFQAEGLVNGNLFLTEPKPNVWAHSKRETKPKVPSGKQT